MIGAVAAEGKLVASEPDLLADLLARCDGDGLARRYAVAVSAHWSEWWVCREELKSARQRRLEGKGRRPSQAVIQRLQRRDRAAWELFDRALVRVEELAHLSKNGNSLAALLAAPRRRA